jgi:type IV secretory pathway VirB10-like protein
VAVLAFIAKARDCCRVKRINRAVVYLTILSGCLLTSACGSSSQPNVDQGAPAFCAAYKAAQQAVDTDFNQHPDLFQKAADIAPADIKAAAQQVVAERTAAQNNTSTTQADLSGLTPSGIRVQTYCLPEWGGLG